LGFPSKQEKKKRYAMNPSATADASRLEGIAARLQSIQESEKEKKDVLGKSDSPFLLIILISLNLQIYDGIS
jgi:hypothetical protein